MFVFGDGNSTEVFLAFSELLLPYLLFSFIISLIILTARIFLFIKKLRYAPAAFISEISFGNFLISFLIFKAISFGFFFNFDARKKHGNAKSPIKESASESA